MPWTQDCLTFFKQIKKYERVFFLTYYNWGQTSQTGQQQYPTTTGQFPTGQFPAGQYGYVQFPTGQGQVTTPPAQSTVSPVRVGTSTAAFREESYIENILRLNRGKVGTFYFTIPSGEVGEATGSGTTRVVRGSIVEAGRDHAIISEADTGHTYLFPMIYFDFAEFTEPINYLPSSPLPLR